MAPKTPWTQALLPLCGRSRGKPAPTGFCAGFLELGRAVDLAAMDDRAFGIEPSVLLGLEEAIAVEARVPARSGLGHAAGGVYQRD